MREKLPQFHNCPRKQLARLDTIIRPYRSHFAPILPSEKQYWTMCGTHAENGEFQRGSELGQMLDAGLIKVNQFVGVDKKPLVIEENREAMPEGKWICGDFFKVMRNAYFEGAFNPGIVFVDSLHLCKRGASLLARVMALLERAKIDKVMLVCNVMFDNPRSPKRGKIWDDNADEKVSQYSREFVSELDEHYEFRMSWRSGNWCYDQKPYLYEGTGDKSRTWMVTYEFRRGA